MQAAGRKRNDGRQEANPSFVAVYSIHTLTATAGGSSADVADGRLSFAEINSPNVGFHGTTNPASDDGYRQRKEMHEPN